MRRALGPTRLVSMGALLSLPLTCGGEQQLSKELGDDGPRREPLAASPRALAPESPPPARADAKADEEGAEAPTGPLLGVVQMAIYVYARPHRGARKLGYLRLGTKVERDAEPVNRDGCRKGFYRIHPEGFVCANGATTDMDHPLMRAGLRGADRTKPLPYSYAFVRAVMPRYHQLPSRRQQLRHEMSLKEHLRIYERNEKRWNTIKVGANDVPVDGLGRVRGLPPDEPPELSYDEKFGGDGDPSIPWFFQDGRQLPNVSGYVMPFGAVMTNRVKRYAGLALVDAFEGDQRHFALTTDLRLVATTKLKPGRGSIHHGVELGDDDWELPLAFVKREKTHRYSKRERRYRRADPVALYTPIQLTGKFGRKGKYPMAEGVDGSWLRTRDVAIVLPARGKPPFYARRGNKWIDVSIQQQTLVLYEGTTPVYATMVSTGRDGLGDPGETYSTVRGTFRVRRKHLTTTMDSDVADDEFELRDVPWVQFFHNGYALHGAYWHGDYGHPRSHGCINLSPIDALRLFSWTDPPLPEQWHGVMAAKDEGTRVRVRP